MKKIIFWFMFLIFSCSVTKYILVPKFNDIENYCLELKTRKIIEETSDIKKYKKVVNFSFQNANKEIVFNDLEDSFKKKNIKIVYHTDNQKVLEDINKGSLDLAIVNLKECFDFRNSFSIIAVFSRDVGDYKVFVANRKFIYSNKDFLIDFFNSYFNLAECSNAFHKSKLSSFYENLFYFGIVKNENFNTIEAIARDVSLNPSSMQDHIYSGVIEKLNINFNVNNFVAIKNFGDVEFLRGSVIVQEQYYSDLLKEISTYANKNIDYFLFLESKYSSEGNIEKNKEYSNLRINNLNEILQKKYGLKNRIKYIQSKSEGINSVEVKIGFFD